MAKENKDFTALGNQILDLIGGKENITKFQHCVTRLRFEFKDKSRIDETAAKAIVGVLGTKWAGEQFQIIIGNDVNEVYEAICDTAGLKTEEAIKAIEKEEDISVSKKDMSIGQRITNFMKPLVDCIIPLIGIFIATGLIKGILSALTVFGVLDQTSGTYTILYAIGDSLFYFFPVFIGCTAGKVFKTNQFMTAAIGAALIYPTIITTQTAGDPVTFIGIPVSLVNYTSSVLPVFFASLAAAKLEKFFSKHCPKALKYMLPVSLTLVIVVPLTFLVIGPVMTLLADGVGSAITAVWNTAPALGGFLLGGLWQILVMTGLHTGTAPLVIQLLSQYGYDLIGVCVTSSMLALAGAAFAMWIRARKADKKDTALSACISSLLGVTEPAIYSIVLPNPKAMAAMILSGGIGGCTGAVLGVKVFGFGGNGLLQLPYTFSADGIMNTVLWGLSLLISFALSFILCFIFCKKEFEQD